MKILMILSNHFSHDPRVYNEAKSLVNAGHEVKVIAWDRNNEYKSKEWIKGINVIRIKNECIMKILPGIILKNPFWWRKAYKESLKLYKKWKFDVAHCHDLDTLQSGVWLKKKLGCKLIYDAHEIFGYMIENNTNKLVVKFTFWMERKLIKQVDYIITVDNSYAKYFKKLSYVKLIIIKNCKELVNNGKYHQPSNKKFSILYIGTINKERFFPQMINTISKINDVELIIISKKENDFYDEIKNLSKKYNNIKFLNPIPTNRVLCTTLKYHVIICLFNPKNRMNIIGSPNKLFEAMVTGRPIIVTKDTNAGNIVKKENCGLSIKYSENELKNAIIQLRDNPNICKQFGLNGLKAAKEKYNWNNEKKKLINIYKDLI